MKTDNLTTKERNEIKKFFTETSFRNKNVHVRWHDYMLNARAFLSIETVRELYRFLLVLPEHIEECINTPVYNQFTIPKKKGGSRTILAPNKPLKELQKTINYYLQAVYLINKPNCAHGFIIKPKTYNLTHNIVSNAKQHTHSKFVMNIDLKDFFPNISAKRVKEAFMAEPLNFSDKIATILALLCTFQKQLPTGSPCSPVVSNFVCIALDKEMDVFCQQHKIAYTRYADDMSFSSNTYFDEELISEIKNIITKHNFIVNEKKFRIQSARRKQTVTGLVVNQGANVDRKYIRNLRAILNHWQKEGLENAVSKHFATKEVEARLISRFTHKIRGKIEFVGMVRGKTDTLFKNLKESYEKCGG